MAISKYVLAAHLTADECSDHRDLLAIVSRNVASAADAGHVVEPLAAEALFDGLEQGDRYVVEDADGVGQYVGFGKQRLDLLEVIAAVVVTAVGDDDHGAPLVARRAQLVDPQVDRVIQGGHAPGLG